MYTNRELQVTTSGNVENEAGSRKLYQFLAADLRAQQRPGTIPQLLAELRELKIPSEGNAPEVKVLDQSSNGQGRREHLKFESAPGIWLDATLFIPSSPDRKSAVLVVKGADLSGSMSTNAVAEEIAKSGRIVLVMEPSKSTMKNDAGPYTGDWVTNVQANMVGLNLPAMRAHDILRGVDLLVSRHDVDPNSIRAAARGVDGIWLLLAAAVDPRIRRIWIDRTPYSLRAALNTSMVAGLWDAVIPNFVLLWDLKDLVQAMGDRHVLWTDPTNWMGQVVSLGPVYEYRYILGDTTDLATAQDDAYVRELIQ